MAIRTLVMGLFVLASTWLPPASAAEAVSGSPVSAPDSATRAQALLEKATARLRAVGDRALAEFGRQGDFIDRELYVYVLDMDGTMLTSGGSSTTLIGRKVSEMRDASGKAFFAEMLNKARTDGRGEVEYRWVNWTDNTVQRKHAFFEKVGERVVAVGYYISRSSPDQALAFLEQAVAAMKAAPASAIAEFNRIEGRFVQDDLYVFVIDRKTGRFVAHGTMPRLVGSDGRDLYDQAGTPIVRKMLEQTANRPRGELDYLWKNPVTKKTEEKHTLFEVVGDHIIAVGYFKP